MTGTVDRRKFLAAAGLTAVGAAAAGVGGELMFGKDFRRTTAAPAPGMTAPAASAPPAAPAKSARSSAPAQQPARATRAKAATKR